MKLLPRKAYVVSFVVATLHCGLAAALDDVVNHTPRKTYPADVRGAPTISPDVQSANPPNARPGGKVADVPRTRTAPPAAPDASSIIGTGIVRSIEVAASRVRLTHDPIPAKSWPAMTMFFRLKVPSLAAGIAEGTRVEFTLERTPTGYVISELREKGPAADGVLRSKR